MKPLPTATRAFSFIELLLVLLLVSLWISGALADLEKYLWLVEIPASLVWFILLYILLSRMIWDITAKRTFWRDIKSLIVFLFVLHVGAALIFRFGFHYSLFLSYPLSFAVCVIMPLVAMAAAEAVREKRKRQPGLSAPKIRDIAMQSPLAENFLRRYPGSVTYVFNHTRDHHVAACLLHHRRSRPERDTLYEDILLEIGIDMATRKALPDQTRIIHYLFQPYQDGSIVMELEDAPVKETNLLSKDILDRFDQILNRFPSLAEHPLPIAVHHGPFEKTAPAP